MSQDVEKMWSLGFLPGELRSHPGKRLKDHLQNVAVLSEKLAKIYELPIETKLLKGMALTHDLGKAHPDFQAYLDKKGSGVNHAEPSSWFTYLFTQDFWAAEIVRRHHTHLRNCDIVVDEWISDRVTEEGVKKTMAEFLPEWPIPLTCKEWKELENYLFDKMEATIEQWLAVRLLYSVLIAADRMEALGIKDYSLTKIPHFSLPLYESKTNLDFWRQHIQQQCLAKAEQIEKPGVYTLTLPTGAGKTLLGLQIARMWADKFNCKTIIYALPFISIVEQNAQEAKKVFGVDVQEDHSLAYIDTQEPNCWDENDGIWHRMMSFFRYWREPVIVTTMVQLWESLFNEYANKSINFHKLSRAIVILDEPQSISPKLWRGMSEILKYLSSQLGTTFLFMTATQPQIEAIADLAPLDLIRPFERHRYRIENKKYDLQELVNLLLLRLPVKEESGLVVLNTKRSAIQVYSKMKEIITDAPVLFLSAWMTPWHRKQVLAKLRNLEENNTRHYLVSTQVVEAGVNLDFDWVFRDMGPLDSIIQVAGRCNRHLNRTVPGRVLVAELLNGNRSLCNIYNDILIIAAREILLGSAEEAVEFGEDEAAQLVKEYYDRIIRNGVRAEPIYDNLAKGIWEDVPPLIRKQSFREIDVIVEQDDRARVIYELLQTKRWTLEERAEQKQLMRELRQYMITIPEKDVSLCRRKMGGVHTFDTMEPFGPAFGGRAYFITKDGIKAGIYDEMIGYIPPVETKLDAEILSDEDLTSW